MNHFFSSDICVLIPTKDRPNKIVNLLDSLVQQSCQVGRIIVVGSGQDINEIVLSYKSKLPIEYFHSEIAGQIRQRKLGVSKLDTRTKLVATLDDDIILKDDAIEKMISFWNSKDEKTAGIGFNITNMQRHSYSRIKELFYLSKEKPGDVLSSGYSTSLLNVTESIPTKWLNGGATIWRQDVLIDGIHKKNIDSTWAPCEDIMFSYPIGKGNDLWICKDARATHDDIIVFPSILVAYRRGGILTDWTYEFVKQNSELNKNDFFIATFVSSILNMIRKFYKIEFFFELGRLMRLVSLRFNFQRKSKEKK
jgi:glycosyltransferase involved in cell wall biosynthesis